MAAAQTSALPSPHSDLITSVRFSPLSTHLASSSLDHSLRIVTQDPATGHWDATPSHFKAHDAPVLALAWAPAEFGIVLASAGVDGTVKLWREELSPSLPPARSHPAAAPAKRGDERRWTCTATLTDPRGTVRDVGFAPAEFGLKLAAVSSDSHLRVWECFDPVGLKDWTLLEDIDLLALPLAPSTAAGPVATGSLAAGGAFETGAGAGVPMGGSSVGGTSSSVSGGSADGRNAKGGTVESDGGWAVSWCREHWWGERLAVSAGTNGVIRLFHLPSHAPWSNFLNLLPSRASSTASASSSHTPSHLTSFPSSSDASASSSTAATHTPPTASLSWAPPSGRSFQLLASGSRDGKARVWKIFPPSEDATDEWSAKLDVELDEGAKGAAGAGAGAGGDKLGSCRVEWNVTGTVLSTSAGEDGKVRLWKSTYTGQWRQLAVLSTEAGDTRGGPDGMSVDK
ncbi:hypothetical protein JCM5296_001172 [Sporobolomyces johnsonii]